MVWAPIPRVDVVKLAIPLLLSATGEPNCVEPSKKVTVPSFGVPKPDVVTVAVIVTACPRTAGLALNDTVVVVGSRPTTCVSPPMLTLKFPSPLYLAVKVYVPRASAEVVTVAVPVLSRVPMADENVIGGPDV